MITLNAAEGTVPTPALAGEAPPPGGVLGKDEFLQLLVAQLRHQDPLNPIDGQDMAVQLAQFSSVEQLMQLNEQLAAQASIHEALAQGFNASAAMNVLGRSVLAATDQVVVGDDGALSVTLEVGRAGGEATVWLYDAAGREVGSKALGTLPAGRHPIQLDDLAAGLEPGTYTIEVRVTDEAGERVPAAAYTTATIDGIRYGEDGLRLVAGTLEFPLHSILEVFVNR